MKGSVIHICAAAACLAGAPQTARAQAGANAEQMTALKRYGESAALGRGEVRTYAVLSAGKDAVTNRRKPIETGVEIPLSAMTSLPPEGRVINIYFPIHARDTPFQYMMLGWNPRGHVPPGIYDKPHFDFHFYIQDLDEVMAIDPGDCHGVACDDYERAVKPVPPALVPEDFVDTGDVVPAMGNHLTDLTAPEFHGKPFTRTMIYGSYDGRITFLEPMITNEELMNPSAECTNFKQPQQYAETAWYPTRYCTQRDPSKNAIKVFLSGFVYRTAAQ